MLRWGDTHDSAAVPENIVPGFNLPSPTGYAEAKYLAEQLLYQAQTKSSIAVSVCRISQIAGPVLRTDGQWNRREWFPSMITSSKQWQVLLSSFGMTERVDRAPIYNLTQISVELALSPRNRPVETKIYHALNPRATTWAQLIPSVLPFLSPGVKVMPFAEWLGALKDRAHGGRHKSERDVNPAVKQWTSFRCWVRIVPVFETDVTEGLS